MAEKSKDETKEQKVDNSTMKEKSKKKPNEEETKITEVLDITTFAEYIQLQNELAISKQEAKDNLELAKNFKKDMDRMKERNAQIEQELKEKTIVGAASKLLLVLDNFEKSFEHIKFEEDLKGFKMIYNSLLSVISDLEVEKIKFEDMTFDADKMNAIMTEKAPSPEKEGKVANIFSCGYIYKPTGKVIRYAQVSIYK